MPTESESAVATVVIPVRNGGDLLRVQLDALVSQVAAPSFEVVVSDNGSTDDSVAIAQSYADRLEIRVVNSSERPGVSHARNVGAAAARTAYVMFCDADDQVSPGWVAAMVDGLQSHDIVGGPLEFERLSEPGAAHLRYQPPLDGLPVAMKFLPYASGGNMGIHTDLMRSLGGFDESFQKGHEEVDLAWRAQLGGASIGFVPDAVGHIRHRSTLSGTINQTFHYGRTYSQLFSRHRTQVIPRTPIKREIRTYLILIGQGLRTLRDGDSLDGWKCTVAWTVGRLTGDILYGVRAPL